jgi:hypothetical protein
MTKNDSIILRKASLEDLPKLSTFFIKVYGNSTIFQLPNFIEYYFQCPNDSTRILKANWIGLNPSGEIVSHYGGLEYKMVFGDKLINAVWGVNAYTLPEYRGQGLNGSLVKMLFEENQLNATIGMSLDTHKFYKKIGYQVFDHVRFSRFIFVFKEDIYAIIKQMGQDEAKAKLLAPLNSNLFKVKIGNQSLPIKNDSFKELKLDLGTQAKCTTLRNFDFISWRFLNNPFIPYLVFIENEEDQIFAYSAIRVENLQPYGVFVARIIDLYGQKSYIPRLLEKILMWSSEQGHLYIDFSKIGELYSEELLAKGFARLDEDEVALFPQVSSPVENRLNNEYIALQSQNLKYELDKLELKDIYFTRMDSDRDRVARLNQIPQ